MENDNITIHQSEYAVLRSIVERQQRAEEAAKPKPATIKISYDTIVEMAKLVYEFATERHLYIALVKVQSDGTLLGQWSTTFAYQRVPGLVILPRLKGKSLEAIEFAIAITLSNQDYPIIGWPQD